MNQDLVPIETQTSLAVTLDKKVLEVMGKQRNLLATFCQEQLKPDVDYGIIPGTQKNSLWKPGAEKLANIFQLGSKVLEEKELIDFEKNIAIYKIKIQIFHIPTGKVISECIGICNSHEKKYRTRKNVEWVANKKIETVIDTPIGDLLNTLVKMAIKRAYVGGVIMATGSSDFFTMDVDEYYEDLNDADNKPPPQGSPGTAGNPVVLPPVEKEKPNFETKAKVDAEAKAAKEGFKAPPPTATERASIGKEILAEKKKLGWNNDQFNKFVADAFNGNDTTKLDITELQLLVRVLQKEGEMT